MIRVPEFVCQRNFAFLGRDPGASRADARTMADHIEAVWRARGHKVQCRVAPVHDAFGRIVVYEIKSDLVNGLPRAA